MSKGQCVFLIGVPGAGKDLQGDRLYTTSGRFHKLVSMSGLIEYALEAGNIPGYTKADKDAGVLLDDAKCSEVLGEQLDRFFDSTQAIVTGFPRTVKQAEFAAKYCLGRGWAITFLILYVTEEVSMKRVALRRDKDRREKGKTRPDDEIAVAIQRFHRQCDHIHTMEPALRRLAAHVLTVDGSSSPDEVYRVISNLLQVSERAETKA